MESLARMTVANGASPNEEAIAQRKIAEYAAAMRTSKPAAPHRKPSFDDYMFVEEQRFRMQWETLKKENRRKWKVE